jgi:hypothetical protein
MHIFFRNSFARPGVSMFVPLFLPLIAARTVSREDETADLPLRAELFSAAQMAAHGKTLASHHRLSKRGGADRLLSRLAENAAVIDATCDELTAAVKQGRQITPASEWLLDNFYLIEEQIRIARRHLPRTTAASCRASMAMPCRPARASTASRWKSSRTAMAGSIPNPVPLRGGLSGSGQPAAGRAVGHPHHAAPGADRKPAPRRRAGGREPAPARSGQHWADQMTEVAESNPSGLILLVADMARSNPPITSAFVAELARRLQGQSPALTLALTWITHRLAESGQTIEQQIQAEIQQQAAEQVSIANSIGSLRFLGTMDWQEFVETMSVVEQTCARTRPASTADGICHARPVPPRDRKDRRAAPTRSGSGAARTATGASPWQ